MTLQVRRLMLCLLMTYVSHSQGLQLSMVRTHDGVYCGHLQCLIDINQTDSYISSLIGLTVGDVTKDNDHVKLASVSLFAPDPYVEQTKIQVINATGSVSRYHADLTLSFRTETDCLYGSFLCELDFMNVSGQPVVIREVVTPDSNGNCPTITNQLLEMTSQIKTYSDTTDRKLTELRDYMETIFDKKLTVLRTDILGELSKIVSLLNLSVDTDQADTIQQSCVRGQLSSRPREKFLLWGNIEALCDTETDDGGWIVIQRRTKGDVDFYRGWNDYKNGFGTRDTDFWFGNDIIHHLTSQGYTDLRIDLEFEGKHYFAVYSNVSIADELSNYRITVGEYNGTAGDSLTYHNGSYFSTYERDNDAYVYNCAEQWHGAWWYKDCHQSNLNGLWAAHNQNGVIWREISPDTSQSFTEMKIRHV